MSGKPQLALVYVVECEGWVKVGITRHLTPRMSVMQVCNPFPITVLAAWEAADAAGEERAIHATLGALAKRRGEWFEVADLRTFWMVVRLIRWRMPKRSTEPKARRKRGGQPGLRRSTEPEPKPLRYQRPGRRRSTAGHPKPPFVPYLTSRKGRCRASATAPTLPPASVLEPTISGAEISVSA
jgi:hypothetical protein